MSSTLIAPELRARLRELRISSRRSAGGDGLGQHSSRSRGAGLEFAQYRAYEPGDEPRRIDWKLYGRSDRFFVREAERDSPLDLWLLLDATASMRQADKAQPTLRKFDRACTLAACLIEIALRQGDRFALATLSSQSPLLIAPGRGARHRDHVALELSRSTAEGNWPTSSAEGVIGARIAAHALVIVISDFFDPAAFDFMRRFAGAGREVRALQLLAADERDFPFSGGHRFIDPESGQERRVDAPAVRKDFLARFGEARAALARDCTALGIALATHVLDEPPERALRELLSDAGARR
ncbi:MAG: DUF58 domain-containing protein [Dokdonella sp.]|uniref:DUF58 domain-containing protein n=1 Tax=Dokdonella sp. TaxID=2291710 RepID=UPI0025B7E178|nr:DUF58 domain-containing protein [Dokdonella sp.]MBZ0222156.1 DUF58 domain-containing protein [Dokdonella sp.]MCC7255539.1 DUF58 domain-containing protein [Dokdonella sp.]